MKKFLIAATFILSGFCSVYAQFGVKGGFNFANLKGDSAEDFNVLSSFHVGALYEAYVFDHVYVQPEFLYSVQGAKIDDEKIKLNYFTVPVLLKVYLTGDLNLQAGPQMAMLISESDNFEPYKSETFDFGFTGGIEFFVSSGIFIQARYYGGTKEVSGISNLKNNVVSASLGFVF